MSGSLRVCQFRPRLRRDDPASWTGPFTASEVNDDPADARSGYRWNARSIGKDPSLMDLLPRNPAVLAVVDQLLGAGRYDPAGSTRGVYCTLPHPPGHERRSERPKIHVDWSHGDRGRLGAIAYIDDVEPEAGAFGVWPGQTCPSVSLCVSFSVCLCGFRTPFLPAPLQLLDRLLQNFLLAPLAAAAGSVPWRLLLTRLLLKNIILCRYASARQQPCS